MFTPYTQPRGSAMKNHNGLNLQAQTYYGSGIHRHHYRDAHMSADQVYTLTITIMESKGFKKYFKENTVGMHWADATRTWAFL